jgi:hypothetical protein
MKKECRLLRDKAINSLILSIEHFNRPSDQGRVESVLIFLDHSFEMVLKAAIIHRGGSIREKGAAQTIGFDACVRKALSSGQVRFLTNEQALTLQSINSLRDAAQHHLLDISESHLYLQAQAGITLFRDIHKKVFNEDLYASLPKRVLPLSTTPPTDLSTLFDSEFKEIKKLLNPGTRRHIEAAAKLRALAIVEGAVRGQKVQPGESELRRIEREMKKGKSWDQVFPGVASINLTSQGYGPSLDFRITKKDGIPVVMVPEGTPGASVVAIKRVDELSFYNLGLHQLADKVGLSWPRTTAMVRYLSLQADPDCFKQIQIGKSQFNRYSQKAIEKIKESLKSVAIDDVWSDYVERLKEHPA